MLTVHYVRLDVLDMKMLSSKVVCDKFNHTVKFFMKT